MVNLEKKENNFEFFSMAVFQAFLFAIPDLMGNYFNTGNWLIYMNLYGLKPDQPPC